MDRGIPTEEILGQMRTAETPIHYLVGTPRGRLSKLEKEFLKLPWEQVRESVQVKLIEQAGELYSGSHTDHIQNPTCLKKPLASLGERVCKA
jgi:hypothetical protein